MKKKIYNAYLICCQVTGMRIVPTNKFCGTEKEAIEYVKIRNKEEKGMNYVYKTIYQI